MKQIMAFLLAITGVLMMAGSFGYAADTAKKNDNPVIVIKTSMGDISVELFQKEAPNTVANFIGLAEGQKEFKDPKTGEMVQRPYYDKLTFHRVIKDFMIQGGCPLGTGSGSPGYKFDDEIDAVGLGLDKTKAMDPQKGPNPVLMIRNQQDFQQYIMMPLYQKLNITSQEELDKRKDEVTTAVNALSIKDVYENMGYKYSAKGSPYPPVRGFLAMANAGPNTNGSQFFINLVDTPWLSGKHTVFGKVVSGMDVVDKIGAVPVADGGKPETPVIIESIRLKK